MAKEIIQTLWGTEEAIITPQSGDYEAHKARMAAASAERSAAGRDIYPLPPCRNPERRRECGRNLALWAKTYQPKLFDLPWGKDHLKAIARLEAVVMYGALLALAMPRGSGKTTLAKAAALWATLEGLCRFAFIIGAAEGHAIKNIQDVKTELETNDLLLEDYPEICYPIRCLDGVKNRANGQLYQGKRTHISYTADEIIYPYIPGYAGSCAVIRTAGITGSIRGQGYIRADGIPVRPDLVILDDPQTEESAASRTQTDAREKVIKKAVLGLIGPKDKMGVIMPCTVIEENDLSDRFLDRAKNPEWNGEKFKLVYKFPTNEKLWLKYWEVRQDGLRLGDNGQAGDDFYTANQAELDAGADISWPERHPRAVSGIQYAMNFKLKDEASFFCEYQNEPKKDAALSIKTLSPDEIAGKLSGVRKNVCPLKSSRLSAFIDVGDKLLYFVIVAWNEDFGGSVVNYGTYPEQPLNYFKSATPKIALRDLYPNASSTEGYVAAGLSDLIKILMKIEFRREDDTPQKIDRLAIDAGWGNSSDAVFQAARNSEFSQSIVPTFGRYIGPKSSNITEWNHRPGDITGNQWRIRFAKDKFFRYGIFDSNYWKSFIFGKLEKHPLDKGAINLYGDNLNEHRMISEHLSAEIPVLVSAKGRTLWEWEQIPNRDNHLFDCLVGAAVAASMTGLSVFEAQKGNVSSSGNFSAGRRLEGRVIGGGRRIT